MEKNRDIVKTDERNIEKATGLYDVTPLVDIYENDDEILLHADMPGVLKKDVSVDIDNGTLSLSGVRKMESKGNANWEEFTEVRYIRHFSVPQTIEVSNVEAELKEGVLRLHLPKSEDAKPVRIEIKTA